MPVRSIAILVLFGILAIGLLNSVYVIDETEQVIITQFGEPRGEPVTTPGLNMKLPFVQRVNRFDKRWLAWDGDPNQVPTGDKKYIWVDCYARWRIVDPLKYFETVYNQVGAQSRLDDIIDGETRNVVASYDLIEVVRATNRKFDVSEEIKDLIQIEDVAQISTGRDVIAQSILDRAGVITPDVGIELVDVRFKRINYVDSVRSKVYERMIAERQRISEQNRSEGQGKSAEIRGQMERDIKEIRSEAYRKTQEIRGGADAESTRIYAEAFNRDPDFYEFVRTLESWEKGFKDDTKLILTTESEFLRFLKRAR